MTRIHNTLLVLTLVLFTGWQVSCTTNTDKEMHSAIVEELGQMNRDFAKALTAHDAKAAAIVYDENASILPPNEPAIKGGTILRNTVMVPCRGYCRCQC